MGKKWMLAMISMVLILGITVNMTGCATKVHAADLMDGIKANAVAGKPVDDDFLDAQMNLAVKLFQSSVTADKDKNVLISPLSIQLALAMTANGADGQTRQEMEQLLGGGISLDALNEYLFSYVNSLPSNTACKLEIANSIWFREGAQVEKDFLQRNADYYSSQIYESPFNTQTLEDINNWVDVHTDGMIDKILDEIAADALLYLINALVFDGEWQAKYQKSDIRSGEFTNISDQKKQAEMMCSEENIYLEDGQAVGFVKAYKGGKYSFAALLPNEDVDIYEYVAGLTGERLQNTLNSAKNGMVQATLPKFSYEYDLKMNEVLKALGMPTAFDSTAADFSNMAHSTEGNIYIGEVLHKTFISVDANGTKAAAVTKVEMKNESIMIPERVVTLDRPFVYMILDNTTNLPVFIGTVIDL